MSDKTDKFTQELVLLIDEGNRLYMAIQFERYPEQFKASLKDKLGKDDKKAQEYINNLPSFSEKYQSWYSKAYAVVKQVLPDRINDFGSYYDTGKARKEIIFSNYSIRDYLQGVRVTRNEYHVIVDGSAAIPVFAQQLSILISAKDALASKLMDLSSIIQADLYDSEVDAAKSLAKAGYLRASGAICGVVVEKHLAHVCNLHNLKITKKHPGISDYNQTLKDGNIVEVAQWRFIQHLADIRNLCDHAKEREPTKDEINDLVSGTYKVLKTVF